MNDLARKSFSVRFGLGCLPKVMNGILRYLSLQNGLNILEYIFSTE